MTTETLCRSYLTALDTGDLNAIDRLFAADAKVVSPLYGVWPAQPFFKSLFAATAKSTTTLINVFDSSQNGAAVALQFRYVWTLATGKTTKFDCVDVFELTADRRRFQKMTIIYDTAPLRTDADWESMRR